MSQYLKLYCYIFAVNIYIHVSQYVNIYIYNVHVSQYVNIKPGVQLLCICNLMGKISLFSFLYLLKFVRVNIELLLLSYLVYKVRRGDFICIVFFFFVNQINHFYINFFYNSFVPDFSLYNFMNKQIYWLFM